MKIIEKTLNAALQYPFEKKYHLDKILFFDIETTGFSPENTWLYLIGCVYYSKGCWNLTQLFAENFSDESLLLRTFSELVSGYDVLIHYNGNGFDIPYLNKKCKKLHIPAFLENIESLDIYKKILPYKKLFKLENLKQKSIESFLGTARHDLYSGGELISVYLNYLNPENDGFKDDKALKLLLLHNEDDLKGLLAISAILHYPDLFETPMSIAHTELTDSELKLSFSTVPSLPVRISYGNHTFYMNACGFVCNLNITLYKGEMKFFYQNYKDYYYLPEEDMAIHKSVAFYVDKNFRTRARAANCYSKKTGCFIPQFEEVFSPFFKIDYYDKITYAETTPELLKDKENLNKYGSSVLHHLI